MISLSTIMTSWAIQFPRLRNCFPLTDWLTHPVKAADDLIQHHQWFYSSLFISLLEAEVVHLKGQSHEIFDPFYEQTKTAL